MNSTAARLNCREGRLPPARPRVLSVLARDTNTVQKCQRQIVHVGVRRGSSAARERVLYPSTFAHTRPCTPSWTRFQDRCPDSGDGHAADQTHKSRAPGMCPISDRAHGRKGRSAHADEGLSGERGHATFSTRGAPPRTDACVKSIARKMLSRFSYFIHILHIPKDN